MHTHNDPLHIEKHLLSLLDCGCYLSTLDIITLGSAIGLELPFKKRATLLQTLLLHARENKKTPQLLHALCTLLESKAHEMKNILCAYPHANAQMQPQLFKVSATQLLLQREFALHVKEIPHDA